MEKEGGGARGRDSKIRVRVRNSKIITIFDIVEIVKP